MANRLFLLVILGTKNGVDLMWGQRQGQLARPGQYPVSWSPPLLKPRALKYFFRLD
jgi:hypothetical protein